MARPSSHGLNAAGMSHVAAVTVMAGTTQPADRISQKRNRLGDVTSGRESVGMAGGKS